MFVLDFNALENGKVAGKVVAGNACIVMGKGCHTVADGLRWAADKADALGDKLDAKGAELKGEEVKKEEKKQAAAPAKKKAEKKKAPVYTMTDVLGKHKNLANAATQLSKEYKNVVFESNSKNKGVLVFNAVRKSDGAAVKVFAQVSTGLIKVDGKTYGEVKEEAPVVEEVVPAEEAAVNSLLNSEPVIEDAEVVEEAQEEPAVMEQEAPVEESKEEEIDGMDTLAAAHPEVVNGIQLMERKYGQLVWGGLVAGGRYAVIANDLVTITIDLEEGTMAHKENEAPVAKEEVKKEEKEENSERLIGLEKIKDEKVRDLLVNEIAPQYDHCNEVEVTKVSRGIVFVSAWYSGEPVDVRIRVRDLKWAAAYFEGEEVFATPYGLKVIDRYAC